jgi:hypothetical protein
LSRHHARTPHTELIAIALAVMACARFAVALDSPSDWKLYAFTAGKNQAVLFFLASEIVRTPPGHVQVWMKAVDYTKLDKQRNTLDKKGDVIERSAEKVSQGYVPPFGTTTKISSDEALQIILFEQMADEASVPPTLRILYEFDCAQKIFRPLSIIGSHGVNESKAPTWDHVPPESTIETLSRLTCRPSI